MFLSLKTTGHPSLTLLSDHKLQELFTRLISNNTIGLRVKEGYLNTLCLILAKKRNAERLCKYK